MMKFYIVDAFTDSPFGGNTAGVVLVENQKDFPEDGVMQQVAAELRYSETAFVKRLSTTEFQIRYFTPKGEVDLCGHATIASFHVLWKEGLIEDNNTYINHTRAETLSVQLTEGKVLMDMACPKLIKEMRVAKINTELYQVMGLSYEEQLAKGLTLIPKIITSGLPDIMMPVKDLSDLDAIQPDYEKLVQLSERFYAVGVHAFTLDGDDATAHVRNFAPRFGIDEESATGTSNGALTFYGYLEGIIPNGSHATFIQGEKMGRPSYIYSTIWVTDSDIKVKVGGDAVVVASGELMI